MKRPPKIHWHAYVMLSLGLFCLASAAVSYFILQPPPDGPRVYKQGIRVIYREGAPSSGVAVALLLSALFIGIGVYAIRKHRD